MRSNWRLLAWGGWCLLFLTGSLVFEGSRSWEQMGFLAWVGGSADSPYLWISLLKTVAQVFALLGILWGIQSFTPLRRHLSLIDFLLLVWPFVCGTWLTGNRILRASPAADQLALFEPLMISLLLPLLLTGVGWVLLQFFRNPCTLAGDTRDSILRSFVVANLVGGVFLALILFLLALAGFWKPVHLWVVSIILLVVGIIGILRGSLRQGKGKSSLSASSDHGKPSKVDFPLPAILGWGFVFILLFGVFQLCWLPPDDSDELRYHLTFPKRYLEAGTFVVLPDQYFSYFPTGMEMLMGIPLSLDWLRAEALRFGLVGGGKFVHAYMAYLCTLLLIVWVRELQEDQEGSTFTVAAPLLFLSIPFVPILASWAFVDFGSALGWLASAYFGWRFFYRTDSIADAALAGVALGWSLMVKYTGLAWCVVFGMVWLAFLAIRKRSPISILLVVVIPTILFSPWLLNNLARTGNPFAPMLSGVFGFGFDPVQKAFYDWHAGMKGDLNLFHHLSFGAKLVDLVRLPFLAAWEPEMFENNPIGGLIPLMFPCFLFGLLRKGTGMLWIGCLASGSFLLWGLTYRDPRFAIPLWGLYLVVVGLGLGTALEPLSPSLRPRAEVCAIVLLLVLGLSQSEELFRRLFAYGAAIELRVDSDDYLARRLPNMRVVREVERQRREQYPKPTLLLLGQEQSYYFDSPVRGTDYFDGPFLADIAKEATDVEQISERLRNEGIDWIFINRETLEMHPANLHQGLWFTADTSDAFEAISALRAGRAPRLTIESGDEIPAFRRMQSWLIRHPGFKEVPLQSVEKHRGPILELYRRWMSWPEMKGVAVEDLPRSGYTLLVRED